MLIMHSQKTVCPLYMQTAEKPSKLKHIGQYNTFSSYTYLIYVGYLHKVCTVGVSLCTSNQMFAAAQERDLSIEAYVRKPDSLKFEAQHSNTKRESSVQVTSCYLTKRYHVIIHSENIYSEHISNESMHSGILLKTTVLRQFISEEA